MNNLTAALEKLPSLRLTVEAHGLMAKKALGQNFLLDRNITDKIIRTTLQRQELKDFSGSNLIEIGPGPGGLTRSALSANPDSMTVIEMDERCIAIMEEIREKTGNRLHIINGDALKTDFAAFPEKPKHIISNLPYNISVPLLTGWLYQITEYQSLTLMFQKEVADRILAPTGCKDYGRISILAQLQCKIERLLDLSPDCFVPAPKIWSSVLLFRPAENPLPPQQLKKIEHLTAMTFGQRRKMIRQRLKSVPELEEKCTKIGVETSWRPEQITPEQFQKLANLL